MAQSLSSRIEKDKEKDKKSKSKYSSSKPSLLFSMFSSRKHDSSDGDDKKKPSSSKSKKPSSKSSSSKTSKSAASRSSKGHDKFENSSRNKHESSVLPSANFRDESRILDSRFFKDESAAPAKLPDTFQESKSKYVSRPSSSQSSMPYSVDFSQFANKYSESSKQYTATKPSNLATETKPESESEEEESIKIESKAPSHIKSVLTSATDIKMATRQLKLSTLPPSERAAQESWALSIIQKVGICPQNMAWQRIDLPTSKGYQCAGGAHFISDDPIAEGKCGIMRTQQRDPSKLWGPFYPDPNNPRKFDYHDLETKPSYVVPNGCLTDPSDLGMRTFGRGRMGACLGGGVGVLQHFSHVDNARAASYPKALLLHAVKAK
ncbi:hypothetical protein IFR04_004146 [Cadophora malorum]|uniref:Uncharacterized protein n=1 Tax=Cadophora malorum TaxID=108018 RepID=A0A8H7WD53_9HELO|nr:hypothetical protein IFR04_004146 [Cadophora malorum]